MKTLRTCVSIFKIKTAEGFQYRIAGISGAASSIVYVIIEIIVYTVFYKYSSNNNAGILAGLSYNQLISYLWLTQFTFLLQPMKIDDEILNKITSGDIGIELCRPLDLYYHWLAKIASGRVAPLFWRGSVVLIAGIATPKYGLSAPDSLAGFLLSIISFISAFFLCTAYGMLVCAVRVNITWGEGPTYILMLIGGILAGSYLPLQLWPDFMQSFLLIQPFAGYSDIPLRLYIGTATADNAMYLIGIQLIWIIIFIAIGKKIMNTRLNKIVVQGG